MISYRYEIIFDPAVLSPPPPAYLQFLDLGSYNVTSTIVPRADDGASSTISITGGFPIGSSTYNSAYVRFLNLQALI